MVASVRTSTTYVATAAEVPKIRVRRTDVDVLRRTSTMINASPMAGPSDMPTRYPIRSPQSPGLLEMVAERERAKANTNASTIWVGAVDAAYLIRVDLSTR